MVFKVSFVETKPIDGQKPGNSGLRKKRLVQQQLTQYPTSEELSIGKIKFKAFDLGGHQIARRVWKDYYAKIIFGNRWRHLLGERDFWEHVGGIDIALAPSSFGQANTRVDGPSNQAFDILLRKLQKYVPFGASVADLYAGAGVIGLSLAATRKCRSVKCIEINKESKLSFEKTADRLPKNCR